MATVVEAFQTMEYGPAPESPKVALDWIQTVGPKFGLYIGGKWCEPKTGEWFETQAPATGKTLASIAQAGQEDIEAAVIAARKAQPAWAALPGTERAKLLYAVARLVQKHSRFLAVLETLDNGKPIRETRDIDIPLVARHFYHHAGWTQILDTEFPGYEPVGVCGQIIPWNFPMLMLAWKIAPALAAGNTIIIKPAEFTSLTALAFADICSEAGIPPGVVNIVTGDGETGKAMVEHPDIDKIAFTGSTEVGRIIRKATAGSGKKISLELGGKSPFIVFEDADLDGAIEGLVDAIWFNQGQVCCAGSRLLVQESVAETVIQKVKARMENLRVGDPLDKAIDIGAIVAPVQLQRIDQLVKQGEREGAELFQPKWACPKEGWFYPPTLLTNVGPASTVAQIEIFGPVLVAMTFRTPKEAVELANNTVYGLASSVWTENINLAHDIASKIKAGAVWVNCTNQFDAAAGFGGYRESGFGREGGKEGMYEYLRPTRNLAKYKSVTTAASANTPQHRPTTPGTAIDRTHKHFIAGKQARPDGGYSLVIARGKEEIEVAQANRKDVRNAVEAALAAQPGWCSLGGHGRAQVLYYLAENLEAEREQFVSALIGAGAKQSGAEKEFATCIERCLLYAGWADKFDGQVHGTPLKGITYTRNEPVGVLGLVCSPESALLGLLQMALPALAMGNAVVALPSEADPIPAALLYRVLDASDVPGGVFNILTGTHEEPVKTLAEHDGVDGIWHFGEAEKSAQIELMSAGNLKQTWCSHGEAMDWFAAPTKEWLRRATQVKNIWVPMGE